MLDLARWHNEPSFTEDEMGKALTWMAKYRAYNGLYDGMKHGDFTWSVAEDSDELLFRIKNPQERE